MTADNLQSTLSELRRDVAKSKRKAAFFRSQYYKYRKATPNVAALHKVMMEIEFRRESILKDFIKKIEKLKKRAGKRL
ncbi:MAG: hypothetical protein WAM91_18080 [Candidatus Acidiferrales bacterium]